MQIFKHILFFILALLICEGIAAGASAWSFLESSLASFEQIKNLSDQRARDTIGAISKSSEGKLSKDRLEDLNFAFTRLVKVTSGDKEGFIISEISMTDDSGVVLASSNEDYVSDARAKRKPEPKFLSTNYTAAHHLRKWQIGTPILLGDKNTFQNDKLMQIVSPYFPEISEPSVLLSMAVYHPEKLERVASLHMKYERGNFAHFVKIQTELFWWTLQNNTIIALICALILGFAHLLIKSVRTSFTQDGRYITDPSAPPLWEKVDFAQTQGPIRWRENVSSTPSYQSQNPAPATSYAPAAQAVSASSTAQAVNREKAEIIDAIYLG
ncbi:LIC_12071 family protein [Leptospira koniambonensis]|uniref:LIC_12071 family protein n=1 Tax=Leptospira koniambonensis TaxID=2484950 RepID=UPI003EB8E7A8